MNDKIEILKELAMTKVYSHGAFGERESRLKLDPDKFAEYIIKDCVSICENAIGYKTLTPAKAKAARETSSQCASAILNHFGIKS